MALTNTAMPLESKRSADGVAAVDTRRRSMDEIDAVVAVIHIRVLSFEQRQEIAALIKAQTKVVDAAAAISREKCTNDWGGHIKCSGYICGMAPLCRALAELEGLK